MSKRRYGRLALALALAMAAIGGAVGYGQRAVSATVMPTVRGTAIDAIYATGTVEAEERAFVMTRTSGTIGELLVREGDVVHRGDVLARIDNPSIAFDLERGRVERGAALAMASDDSPQVGALRAQADSMHADLAAARRENERIERLFRAGAVPQADLDRTRTRIEQLEAAISANAAQQRAVRIDLSASAARQNAQVKSLASRVADTELRSPIDGMVLTKLATVGDVVGAGQPLFKIGDTTSLVLELTVDEADVARVSDGRRGDAPPSDVAVSLYAFPGQVFHGRVFEVMPDALRERKAFVTKVRLTKPPPSLRSGMSAEVNIIAAQKKDVLLVPTPAEADGAVWVVEGGRAHRRGVKTGIRDLLRVEVEGGLTEGELVVVAGHGDLREGARVSATVKEQDKYLPMPDLNQPIQTAVK